LFRRVDRQLIAIPGIIGAEIGGMSSVFHFERGKEEFRDSF